MGVWRAVVAGFKMYFAAIPKKKIKQKMGKDYTPAVHLKFEGTIESKENNIFAQYANGRKPVTLILGDAEDAICFSDIHPKVHKGGHHLLVIPKRRVRSVNGLRPTDQDITLLRNMITLGRDTLRKIIAEHGAPDGFTEEHWRIGFHIPPAISVAHLHLHFICGTLTRQGRIEFENPYFFVHPEDVIKRLEELMATSG